MNLQFAITEVAKELNKTHQAIHRFCSEHGIKIVSGKNRAFFEPESLREYLIKFSFLYPQLIIAFQACKGGVGKTSLCYNISARAAQFGARVLAIDMDMQAHLTIALLQDSKINFKVWQDILNGTPIKDTIIEIHPHLHLIPSHLDNSYMDKKISQSNKIIYTDYVKKHLETIKDDYDLIFIDCAPALSHINTSVALAADKIFIPVNPDVFSFDGLEKTIAELNEIQTSFQKEMDVSVILNRFDAREGKSLDIITDLRVAYGKLLTSSIVGVSAEIKNTIARKEFLFDSRIRKKTQVADDINAITREILKI